MAETDSQRSRRDFVARVGKLASAVSLAACMPPAQGQTAPPSQARRTPSSGEYDLSWIDRLDTATDRAVFDWPTLGDPADGSIMQFAERYLDNCDTAYGRGKHEARVVLNIRTTAIAAALNDAAWQRYSLGTEYNAKDPHTKEPAVRNPFWHQAPDLPGGYRVPSVAGMVERGSLILVCDFALGHLSRRLATKMNRDEKDVHRDLLASFVPSSYAVPSGMFGLARAQNAGCAFMRL